MSCHRDSGLRPQHLTQRAAHHCYRVYLLLSHLLASTQVPYHSGYSGRRRVAAGTAGTAAGEAVGEEDIGLRAGDTGSGSPEGDTLGCVPREVDGRTEAGRCRLGTGSGFRAVAAARRTVGSAGREGTGLAGVTRRDSGSARAVVRRTGFRRIGYAREGIDPGVGIGSEADIGLEEDTGLMADIDLVAGRDFAAGDNLHRHRRGRRSSRDLTYPISFNWCLQI